VAVARDARSLSRGERLADSARIATMKPFSEASERNRGPILKVLRRWLTGPARVLEIGSGTGQHAVHFAAALPHVDWQPSDRVENLPGIAAWIDAASLANLATAIALDVNARGWPEGGFHGVFSANTAHIMSWQEVERMFAHAAAALHPGGLFMLYGPFNYGGRHTAESNARFDASLRAQAAHMGIRDFEAVERCARANGFVLLEDNAMPANNRLLVWRRAAPAGGEPS
jgi:cyclopropane fatty-acyl-phospholipid synthase-like methyltransferase